MALLALGSPSTRDRAEARLANPTPRDLPAESGVKDSATRQPDDPAPECSQLNIHQFSTAADYLPRRVDQLTDVQKGLIGLAIIAVIVLLLSSLGSSSLMAKEVDVEAHKRLVGKLAEDKATAQYKREGAAGAFFIIVALIIGAVIYAENRSDEEPGPDVQPTELSTTSTAP